MRKFRFSSTLTKYFIYTDAVFGQFPECHHYANLLYTQELTNSH